MCRCQNVQLVPKLFDKYRARCRSGGTFLAPSIYYRIAENLHQVLTNSPSDIFVV